MSQSADFLATPTPTTAKKAKGLVRRNRAFLEQTAFVRADDTVLSYVPDAYGPEFRARVDRIVRQSEAAWPGIPIYEHTPADQETWRLVSEVAILLQNQYSCEAYLEGREKLGLPSDQIPQLDDVSAKIEVETDVLLAPVGGYVEKSVFLSMLRHKVMPCIPYVRHPSNPFFALAPDLIHDLRGHAPMFMNADFVEMFAAIGHAAYSAVAANNDELLETIARFYWFTVEFGLIREGDELKIFGAATNGCITELLRSVDPNTDKRPLSIEAIQQVNMNYDAPQDVFFVCESYEQIKEMAYELASRAD